MTQGSTVPDFKSVDIPDGIILRSVAHLLDTASDGVKRYARHRRRRATEQAIAAMPAGIVKDLGWPAPEEK